MINEYLKENSVCSHGDFYQAPRIECADGESVSIQASGSHYCTPREANAYPYTDIEAGFPTVEPPASWMEYCENTSDPTGTVYGYMPVAIAEEFIIAHGGIKK